MMGKRIRMMMLVFLVGCSGLSGLFASEANKAYAGRVWKDLGDSFVSNHDAIASMFAVSGIPHVAYSDRTEGGTGPLTVKKYFYNPNGGSNGAMGWTTVGKPDGGRPDGVISDGTVSATSVYSNNGTDIPYIAYREAVYLPGQSTPNGLSLSVKKYNDVSDLWDLVGPAGFSPNSTDNASLDVDNSTGIPYVAYVWSENVSNKTEYRVSVRKYNAGTNQWDSLGAFLETKANSLSLKVYNGTPYLAYIDFSASGSGITTGIPTVKKFNGTSWVSVDGKSSAGASAISSETTAGNTQMSLYNGSLYVSYQSGSGTMKVLKYDTTVSPTTWETVGANDIIESWRMGSNLVLYVDNETGIPYVGYMLTNSGISEPVVMKYVSDTDMWIRMGDQPLAGLGATIFALYADDYTPYVGLLTANGIRVMSIVPVPPEATYSPATNASDVAVGTDLKLTFSEDVTAVSGKFIHIMKSLPSGDIEESKIEATDTTQVTVNAYSYYYDPETHTGTETSPAATIDLSADLEYGTDYFVQIDEGAFRSRDDADYAGIAITDKTTWKFRTEPDPNPDTTAPTAETYSPANGSATAAVDTDLTLTFSENVARGDGSKSIVIRKSDDAVVATIPVTDSSVMVAGNRVTIHLASDWLDYDTVYYVTIDQGAFTDLSINQNLYAGITDNTMWSFKTAEPPLPVFTVGDGTANSPYQITNPDQLNAVRDYLDKHFIVMNDINLNVEPYNAGAGWQPIGAYDSDPLNSKPFTGKFDGNEKTISGLTIKSNEAYLGLFGYVSGAAIQNMKLTGVDIQPGTPTDVGGGTVGSLAGAVDNSVVTNVSAKGNIVNKDRTGGLIGVLGRGSSVSKVSANVALPLPRNGEFDRYDLLNPPPILLSGGVAIDYDYRGGLVGLVNGTSESRVSIKEGRASGASDSIESIIEGGSYIGGLIGSGSYVDVERSYAQALEITGYNQGSNPVLKFSTNVGGFAGQFVGATVKTSSAGGMVGTMITQYVKGNEAVAGFVGRSEDSTYTDDFSISHVDGYTIAGFMREAAGTNTIDYAYFAGKVEQGETEWYGFGPLSSVNATNAYYDNTRVPGSDNGSGVGKSSVAMQDKDTFNGWNFSSLWSINFEVNGGYPHYGTYVAPSAPAFSPAPTAQPGTAAGSTSIILNSGTVPAAGNRLVVKVSPSSIATPKVGDAVPTGTGATDPYTSGNDIAGVDDTINKYIGLYEVNGSGEIERFTQIELISSDIKPVTPPGPANAETPTISTQPQGDTVSVGTPVTLSVDANVNDGGTLSYQWYVNTIESNSGGSPLNEATSATFAVPTNVVGSVYYYAEITNTNDNATVSKTATVASAVVKVEVQAGSSTPSGLIDPSKTYEWEQLGSELPGGHAGNQGMSTYFDNGVPYVALLDSVNVDGAWKRELTVYKYVNNQWEAIGNKEDLVLREKGHDNQIKLIEYVSLVVKDGTPYVAYAPGGGEMLVKYFDEAADEWVEAAFGTETPTNGAYMNMIVGPDQAIYVAYRESDLGGGVLRVKKYDNETWSEVGNTPLEVNGGSSPTLAFHNNQLQVIYSIMNGGLKLATLNGANWTRIDLESKPTLFPSIVWTTQGEEIYNYITENTPVSFGHFVSGSNTALADTGMGGSFLYATSVVGHNNELFIPLNDGKIKKSDGTSVLSGNWSDLTNVPKFADNPMGLKNGLHIDGNAVYIAYTEGGKLFFKKLVETGGSGGTIEAVTPTITTQPIGKTAKVGDTVTLSVDANVSDGGTISYQWFVSDTAGTGGFGFAISGATSSTYPVPTSATGTAYYFVEVTNTNDNATGTKIAKVQSSKATVVVEAGVPTAPTNVTAVAGDGRATISFTPSSNDGGSPIAKYIVTSQPDGITAEGTGSPITITGLTNGTSYTFTVKAINSAGSSAASDASSAVVPRAPSGGNGDGSGGGSGSGSGGTGSSGANGGKGNSNEEAVIVLVNGKEENAGTAITGKRNEQTLLTIAVDQKKLDDKLAAEGQGAVVTIPVKSKSDVIIGELNGQMVKNMENKEAVLVLQTGHATYTIPAHEINIDAIFAQLGKPANLADIKVRIEISASRAEKIKLAENAAEKGTFSLVMPPLEFDITAVYGNQTVNVTKFNAYVERTVAIPDGIDPNKITTGVVIESDGSVRHVPTQVTKNGARYFAKINSLTNSTYAIVWNPIEFSDVGKHWAKSAVNDMGSRMVIDGTGGGKFTPNRDITRAEFAAILVRGLGLKPENGVTAFSDVKASDWYSGVINTAYAYQLIDGFQDGTFRPKDKITREQAMLILSKAMVLTGLADTLSVPSADAVLSPYGDASKVAKWAQSGAAGSVQAGIVTGRSADTLAPKANMTRAEVAAIVQRLLQKSELIEVK
ncbi:S-layer homology domain-containing protein [Cohnella sp. LGH]|uniref:S-layer homology domain-containing protein n=1 Tax=Cohnella sp. LGH TaxID=1619153 RepID=UPI001ADA89C7|nr:S-layer homology domain-containing protein [Cohnella sp. LGH]QTH43761.1 S-layer homology domain-containing protein [Cohnella sp. LGH]